MLPKAVLVDDSVCSGLLLHVVLKVLVVSVVSEAEKVSLLSDSSKRAWGDNDDDENEDVDAADVAGSSVPGRLRNLYLFPSRWRIGLLVALAAVAATKQHDDDEVAVESPPVRML